MTFQPLKLRESQCTSLMTLSLLGCLVGCEAELRLEGVEATLAQPVLRTDQFLAVSPSGPESIVALADNGVVLEGTANNGVLSWQRQVLAAREVGLPQPTFLASTDCPDGSVVALSFENEIWTLSGGGWRAEAVDTEEQLQDVACSSDGTLWTSGAFGTLLSRPTGSTDWVDHSFYDDFTLTAMSFVPQTGASFAVGEFGTFAKSTDSGDTWDILAPIAEDFYPLDVYFTDANTGWVSGVLGVIYATKDGGESWSKEPSETEASIYGFTEIGDRVFAFGDLGTLLEYESSQMRWVTHPSPETPIHFAAATGFNGGLLVAGGWGLLQQLPLSETPRLSGSANQSTEDSP